MEITKHNPDYKLVSTVIDLGKSIVEVVYGETNKGENKGLEVYYHKVNNLHHYRSFRYAENKLGGWLEIYNSLQNKVKDCPEGCKLSLRQLTDYIQ